MTKTKSDNQAINKQIQRGEFREKYLVYNRKSLDEPNSQKNSIKYQSEENTRYGQKERLSLADVTIEGFCRNGVISEKHSGFKEGEELNVSDDGYVQYKIERPKFQRLIQHLSRGHFKGVVCLCWDRISRNKGDDTIIKKLMERGIDIQFVYAKYDDTSAGKLHMDIDGMFAQHHSRVTSEKVRLSTKSLRAKGKCTYRAPIGYLNTGTTDLKAQDPDRAPIIADLFKRYAEGDWSLSDLARHANSQGLKTVPMRRRRSKQEILAEDGDDQRAEKVSLPMTENRISRILSNPFYTGKVLGPDGEYIDSTSHEALVDDKLFNQVQGLLKKKNVSIHYTKKPDHPLRGMVRCAGCKRVYTPYTKKGILYYYARCPSGCGNSKKSINFDFLSSGVRELLANLHFTTDELDEFNARTRTEIVLLDEQREREFALLERKKKRIREDLNYLREERLQLLRSGAFSASALVEEQRRLEAELDELEEKEQISEQAMRDLTEDVVLLSELLKMALPVYDTATRAEKESIIKIIFSELFVMENTLEFKVKKGFEPLLDRVSAIGYPIEWLSEYLAHHDDIKDSIERLKKLISVSSK